MARKVLMLDETYREPIFSPDMIEESEVAVPPTANGIPRADGLGKIAEGWIPDAVRTVNVQEADGNPALSNISTLVFDSGSVSYPGGGIARITGGGGGGSLTIREIDGVPSVTATVLEFPNGVVEDMGNGVARVTATGDANATQIQGRDVSTTAPADGEALIWNNAAQRWEPGAGGGGSSPTPSAAAHLYLYHRYI